jgi:hypothetical protein
MDRNKGAKKILLASHTALIVMVQSRPSGPILFSPVDTRAVAFTAFCLYFVLTRSSPPTHTESWTVAGSLRYGSMLHHKYLYGAKTLLTCFSEGSSWAGRLGLSRSFRSILPEKASGSTGYNFGPDTCHCLHLR